jgi:hypothetical protein
MEPILFLSNAADLPRDQFLFLFIFRPKNSPFAAIFETDPSNGTVWQQLL